MKCSSSQIFKYGFCGIAALGILLCSGAMADDAARKRGRPLLGVQRWDMYSGKGATQAQELGYLPGKQGFLDDPEWHDRAPFFCRLTQDVDWIQHPENAGSLWFNHPFDQKLLQQAMDQEIRFAHNAGIDFFIYNGPTRNLVANTWELKNNLDCHINSSIPEATKMNFVWALYGHQGIHYTRSKVATMMDETLEYIQLPNWQKVLEGRPLIMVLWPDGFKKQLQEAAGNEQMTSSEFVQYIRKRVTDAGLKNPYIVGSMVPAKSFDHAKELKSDGYDAFMDYAGGYGGGVAERDKAPSYAEATNEIIDTFERKFSNQGLPFIPPCTSMQYPWPRAYDHKTLEPKDRWYHYGWPQEGDLTARVKAVFDYVATHPESCEAQVVAMYSWNEHSEGGGLCPTMGKPPEYKPVTQWLDEVAHALKTWEYPKKSR